jgi:hypothetical protein
MAAPVPMPSPTPAPAPARRSLGGLFAVCFLVLVLAATVTFIALRYRAQLGF